VHRETQKCYSSNTTGMYSKIPSQSLLSLNFCTETHLNSTLPSNSFKLVYYENLSGPPWFKRSENMSSTSMKNSILVGWDSSKSSSTLKCPMSFNSTY
jgi:hypothetical protein